MNTNDYHVQYHRPLGSIIYVAMYWWVFIGLMIVVAPIRAIVFISRQVNANDLYITLCWVYIATKVLGYSSDIVLENNHLTTKPFEETFIYY